MNQFTCPKCGGHQYGIDKLDEAGSERRYCYGIDPWFCTFRWTAADDYLYIKPVAEKADPELEHLRELVGTGEPVAVVTEFGGLEYFEPLPEGTFLYIHHYTKQDIARAEQYAKELTDKLRVE